jgi:BirA family transcriptional regulator, biotin operon repressor / biotin---[acetyl-CoA-carboxylase] ligase
VPVYSDVPDIARTLLPGGSHAGSGQASIHNEGVAAVVADLFGTEAPTVARLDLPFWTHIVVADRARGSQYERLIALARAGVRLPHGLACVALSGDAFQGFHGRSWVGARGNLHLSVHLAPRRPIERFESVFLALSALSAAEAIDTVPGLAGRARLRWVNDIVIDEAKVGGVLAHTQSRGAEVTGVILGIGINVEVTPDVAPTAFVPSAGSLRDHAPDARAARLAEVFRAVLAALARNYSLLLDLGYAPLVARYRARSSVLGREVVVSDDTPDQVPHVVAAGRVTAIGDGLELILDGGARLVRGGRLVVAPPAAERPVVDDAWRCADADLTEPVLLSR